MSSLYGGRGGGGAPLRRGRGPCARARCAPTRGAGERRRRFTGYGRGRLRAFDEKVLLGDNAKIQALLGSARPRPPHHSPIQYLTLE